MAVPAEAPNPSSPTAMQPPSRLIIGLVLIALPLIEIALLIKSGQMIGFWPVILIVVITGLVGARIIRTQGVATFRRISEAIAAGREPHDALANGALLLLAGGLLLLPGPITDLSGMILLIPAIRQWIGRTVFKPAIFAQASSTRRQSEPPPDQARHRDRQRPDDTIIEGEFERLDERTVDRGSTNLGASSRDRDRKPPSRPSPEPAAD